MFSADGEGGYGSDTRRTRHYSLAAVLRSLNRGHTAALCKNLHSIHIGIIRLLHHVILALLISTRFFCETSGNQEPQLRRTRRTRSGGAVTAISEMATLATLSASTCRV
jgi:hypothetical protein